jgi:cytochrome b561
VLYALMFAVPLVGWAMLSAARYPVVLYGPLQLPDRAAAPRALRRVRMTHTVLALLRFVAFLEHLSAALMHALIFWDEVFPSITSFRFSDKPRACPIKEAEKWTPLSKKSQ